MTELGTILYIVHAEPGQWSSGPMVLTKDAFSDDEWNTYVEDWARRGCKVVVAKVIDPREVE